jgi:hypothetical protein
MSVECRSIPNASGKYDSSPEETHKQERTRRKTKKEYTAINQGRWNSACGCRSGCGSRSRLELLWGRCGRAGVALFDVLLLDLGSGRHRPTSETTAHFMFPKMSRRGRGGKNRNGSNWFGDAMPDVPGNFFTIANGLEHEPAANQDGTTHLYADVDLRRQQLPAWLPRRRP